MPDEAAKRILVVDDTEGNRYTTVRLLRSAGYALLEAETGSQAVATAVAERPDLIVLDVNLPDMSGFEVVTKVRQHPLIATTPVLHLSASYTTSRDRAHGLDHGADAYLIHPIEPVVLVATVRSLLRAGEADRRLSVASREWQATFDAMNHAVLLLDQQAIVRRANRAACALLGAARGELTNQFLGQLLQADADDDGRRLVDVLLEGQPIAQRLFHIGNRSYRVSTHVIDGELPSSRTVCVLEDVSEYLAGERERARLLMVAETATRDAIAANEAKSQFLAVMSHELRTPLNAIGGYTQLIDLGIRGPVTDAQRTDLDRIKRSQRYLLALINDVLNFAQIESGRLNVDITAVPIGALMLGMHDFVMPQIEERQLRFTCESISPEVCVDADADKVQQILINLLSNALKFTPPGGAVTLAGAAHNGHVDITVCDTGQGIAADKLETIFDPFVQMDRRFNREHEGIGLGLTISRELARAMQGDLHVTSILGAGTTFTLRLRRSADMAAGK